MMSENVAEGLSFRNSFLDILEGSLAYGNK